MTKTPFQKLMATAWVVSMTKGPVKPDTEMRLRRHMAAMRTQGRKLAAHERALVLGVDLAFENRLNDTSRKLLGTLVELASETTREPPPKAHAHWYEEGQYQ